jgi:hypothetical protein
LSGRRPGRLWLLFYGRRRRGFPGLLVAVLGLALILGLTFASRAGAAVSYWIGIGFLVAIAVLVLVALAVALAASLRRPGGR